MTISRLAVVVLAVTILVGCANSDPSTPKAPAGVSVIKSPGGLDVVESQFYGFVEPHMGFLLAKHTTEKRPKLINVDCQIPGKKKIKRRPEAYFYEGEGEYYLCAVWWKAHGGLDSGFILGWATVSEAHRSQSSGGAPEALSKLIPTRWVANCKGVMNAEKAELPEICQQGKKPSTVWTEQGSPGG